MIKFFNTHISTHVYALTLRTLRSTYLSEGALVKKFETKLALDLGVSNPVCTNSGTSALHLALVVAGIKQGDEVILSPQTFIATGMVILQQGAKPVFADIQVDTGNIDPVSVRNKITTKTKAIIVVHWGGYPGDLDEIHQLAKEFGLIVIEDAAHALGATYKSRVIGSISPYTVFSFQAIKHLTTGDGGLLCCIHRANARKAKVLSWFGIDRKLSKPSALGERIYNVSKVGYKYHMNDLAAAVGLGNLRDLKKQLKRRQEIALLYSEGLKNVNGLQLLSYKNDRTSAYWLYTVLVKRRLNFIKYLKQQRIPASVVHLRIDKNAIFGGKDLKLKNQEYFDQHQVSLPIHSGLSDVVVRRVINVIKKGW